MGRKGKYKPPKKDAAEAPSAPAGDACPFVSRGGLKLRRALDAFGPDVTALWCADLGCSTGGFTDCLLQAGAARVYAVDTAYGELAWKIRTDDRVAVMERTNAVHAAAPEEVVERGGVDLVVIDLGWTAQAKAIPAALKWLGSGSTNERGAPATDTRPARAENEPEAQAKDERATPSTNAGTETPSLALRARRENETPSLALRARRENETPSLALQARRENETPSLALRARRENDTPSLALQAREGSRSSGKRVISLIKPHYEVAKDELGEGGVLDPERARAVADEVCDAMPGLGVRVLDLVESPVLGGKKKGKGTGNREWLVLLEPTTIPS